MTAEEYYKILKEKWDNVNQNSLQEIKAYNQYRNELRKELENGKDE